MSVTGRPVTKGYLARIDRGQIIAVFDFRLNPSQVTRTHKSNWLFESPSGSPLPQARWKSCDGPAFSLELLLDEVESYDPEKSGTEAQEAELESYVSPNVDKFTDNPGAFTTPPQIRYGMGVRQWNVVVEEVTFVQERWNRQGDCTRCRATLTMKSNFVDVAAIHAEFDRIRIFRRHVVRQLTKVT